MYEYKLSRKSRQTVRNVSRSDRQQSAKGSVVTILEPALRQLVVAATMGQFTSVHVDTIEAARKALEDPEACAVLLSPTLLGIERMNEVSRMIARHPEILPVAIVHRQVVGVSERVLALGRCGVSRIVELESDGGCRALRATLEGSGGIITKRIAAVINPELTTVGQPTLRFFSTLTQSASTLTSARLLAAKLGVLASTLSSRFLRAGIPSPKEYLARTRLLFVSAYLDSPTVSIADVAYKLEYSSPQSLGRNIRLILGVSGVEFRKQGFESTSQDYVKDLIRKHLETFVRFDPFQ